MTKMITWCDNVNLFFEIKLIICINFNNYIQNLIFWIKLKNNSKDCYTKFMIPTTKKILGDNFVSNSWLIIITMSWLWHVQSQVGIL